jgi:hypothetical protein
MHFGISPRLFLALLALGVLMAGGCRRNDDGNDGKGVEVELTVRPEPPKVGLAKATVKLTDEGGKPLPHAKVKLEGNMTHPGMTPVFADAKEVRPGQYQGDLDLTMGGDWVILIDANLADGRRLHRVVNLPGVRSR